MTRKGCRGAGSRGARTRTGRFLIVRDEPGRRTSIFPDTLLGRCCPRTDGRFVSRHVLPLTFHPLAEVVWLTPPGPPSTFRTLAFSVSATQSTECHTLSREQTSPERTSIRIVRRRPVWHPQWNSEWAVLLTKPLPDSVPRPEWYAIRRRTHGENRCPGLGITDLVSS